MQRALIDAAAVPVLGQREGRELDRALPEWARRSNPIVRRHLGAYWKMLTPNVGLIVRLFLLQVALVLASIAFPALLTILMPTVTVSLVLLPLAFVMYAQLLIHVGVMSADSVVAERRNGTLDLLLVIPRSLTHILYGKVAAAVWRQVENLGMLALGVVLVSIPVLIIQNDILYSIADNPLLMRAGVILALASSLLRLILEPIMIGAIGTLVGAAMPLRIPALVATLLTGVAYFAAINLVRLLPLDPFTQLQIDTVLPVVLPVVIALASFRLAARLLRRT